VNNVDDAEFILAHGTEALGVPSGDPLPKSHEELEHVLMLCLEKRLPMVVANPDYVTVEARDLRVMPGIIMMFTKCYCLTQYEFAWLRCAYLSFSFHSR
jgi:hypothetical protein